MTRCVSVIYDIYVGWTDGVLFIVCFAMGYESRKR